MNPPPRTQRVLHVFLLAAAAVLLGLHFVHLTADFPNHSPWMDWSKYTDEGWYGDAAIRHFQLGHWYVPGDFNPAVALPVWPALEALVFAVTGVSLAAARALTVSIFAGILIVSWFLVSRLGPRGGNSVAASVAVFLLAASPFCFVFTRMAIIEPLLILLMLLALLVATAIHPVESLPGTTPAQHALQNLRANLLPALALGVLLPLMVLCKTTALFLMPAVCWLLFARARYSIAGFLRLAVPPGLIAVLLWTAYFLALVRPHFLADYRYLFSANGYTGMTRQNFASVLSATLKDGSWMGRVFYPFALVAALIAIVQWRRLAACPLIPVLLFWSAGYMAFLAYHNNLQPRYYLVVAVPLTLLLPLVAEDLILPRLRSAFQRGFAAVVAVLVVAAIALPGITATLHYVTHPEYTLVRAAEQVAAYIRHDRLSDPSHNPLILSISGSDISLITGLPSICDDFGTLELVDRVKAYRPGWYVAWNQVEDDKLDAIAPQLRLERVAAFPAMDDPDRNLMILYRILPATETATGPQAPAPARRHPATPRPVRTRVGQQPSVNQLEH